jgi:hypothetical protein
MRKATIIAIFLIAAFFGAVLLAHADESTSHFAPIIAQTPRWNGWVVTNQGDETEYPGYYCGSHDCNLKPSVNTSHRDTECSSALQRDAMTEYDTIAGMVGIPAGAQIYTLEKKQYIAAVCLHDAIGKREIR